MPQSLVPATADSTIIPLEDILALHRALISARARLPHLDAFLVEILDTLCSHLAAGGSLIGLLDSEQRSLAQIVTRGVAPEAGDPSSLGPLPGFCEADAPTRNTLALEWAARAARSTRLEVLAAAPLIMGDEEIGIVCLFGPPGATRYVWQEEGLAAAALEIGLAVSHLRLRQGVEEQLRERNERWSALYEMAVSLTKVMDSDRLLDELVQRAIRLLHARGGSLSVTDEATGESVVTVAYVNGELSRAMLGFRLPPGEGLAAEVMKSGQTLYLPDYQFVAGSEPGSALRTSVIAAPLFVQNVPAGVLAVGDNPATRRFTRDDIETLELLAQAAGAILEKAHGRTREQTLTLHRERARLARELHDGLAQNLASLLLKAELCYGLAREGAPDLVSELDSLADGLQRAIRETRGAIASLHDSASNSQRLVDALALLAARFQEQTGQAIEVTWEGDRDRYLPTSHHMALLGVAQEALTNVRKHAKATNVCVHLNASCRKSVQLTVQDNGSGFDSRSPGGAAGHYGLTSMQGRVEELGGSFCVDTAPGCGTTVAALLPLAGGESGNA